MDISVKQIKELRDATGAGMMDCKEALTNANGDFDKAVDFLREKGLAKAAKRAGREASDGIVEVYSHGGGRIGVMVEVNCETDFVAKSEAFQKLAHEIALQIAATSPECVSEDQLTEEMLDREAAVARNRAIEEGKPEQILDKIVAGRLEKYKDEVVLLRQEYIRDSSMTIQDLLSENVASIGENVVIRRFIRYELGEHSQEDADEE
ncbi:MAG: translation elongation factor Ts [Anaerolineales bacterium]